MAALIAGLVIHLVLILPAMPLPWPQVLTTLPPELPLLLVVLMLGRGVARAVLAPLLTLLALQKLADLAMLAALGRVFNGATDLPLLDAGVRLIAGSFGTLAAIGVVAGACLGTIGIACALWWATGVWARGRRHIAICAGLVLFLILPATNTYYVLAKTKLLHQSLADLRQFRQIAARDPMAQISGMLGAIDRDVLVIFIESYGRASFDIPQYADTHLATLREAEAQLRAAGLDMRSGFLTAPTQGGQSWLSHATFANGLWINDQSRYQAALVSGRDSLFHHARRAGFRTAAVMPAITRPWPEAQGMGFDHILASADLGYRGVPFNWVTMPDQFTLNAADRLLQPGSGTHLFAQVVLISSHAPWVPVPRLLQWEALGDGRVFDQMARAGDPPEVVWRDPARVQDQYRMALDYALRAVMSYARRHAANPPLLIVLGDHQATPRIALDPRPQVPIHLIGPHALVERSADWGFDRGLIPRPDHAPIGMDQMRDLILRSFAAPAKIDASAGTRPPPPG